MPPRSELRNAAVLSGVILAGGIILAAALLVATTLGGIVWLGVAASTSDVQVSDWGP